MGLEKYIARSRDSMRKHYVERRDEALLYVPSGVQSPLFRQAYLLPDEPAIERILSTHRAISRITTGVVAAGGLGLVACLLEWPTTAMSSLGLLVGAIWIFFTLFAVSTHGHLVAWKFGLEKYAKTRDLGQVAESFERIHGTRGLALTLVFVAVVTAFTAWVVIDAYRRGHVALSAFVIALALFNLPTLFLFHAMRRTRRLRAENARLEEVVSQRARELRDLNETLEQRVRDQVRHIERLGQLKHFFAAPVAEMILAEKGFDPAKVHRRELTAVSIDLRGFTAFSETSEPEEVISVLRIYHAELGIQVNRCQATLEHFAGDGAMLFLNDPVELPDHPMRAIELAVALREAMQPYLDEWKANGFDIGLGIGIATGYATIGAVGYEGRWEYAAIGTVCNLAARLCAEAKDGQIVVSKRFISRLGDRAQFEALGERALKGLSRPVAAFNVVGLNARIPETT